MYMTVSPDNELCRSLDIRQEHHVVWQKTVVSGYTISLRPVHLHNNQDMEIIGKWIEQGYAIGRSVDQLRIMYTIIAECTYIQSFMVLVNGQEPICVVDVGEVIWDEVVEYYDHHPGDHRLQLPVLPISPSFSTLALDVVQTCLEYFFSFPQVLRMVWTIYTDDTYSISMAEKAGFQLVSTVSEKGRPMAVFLRGRQSGVDSQ
jgi:hypothetical protein